MTDEFIPRSEPDLRNLVPTSPREKQRVWRIKKILREYVVRGTEEDLEKVAIRIWREIKR